MKHARTREENPNSQNPITDACDDEIISPGTKKIKIATRESQKDSNGISVKIQNVVSSFDLKCKLDLRHLALLIKNSEYDPNRFTALVVRIRSPKTTALIFSTGKVIVTGATDEEAALLAARKYARKVQKLDYPVKFSGFAVCNIVGCFDVDYRIRLEGMAFERHTICSYEPELFPGLIYRMKDPKVVFLIFVSGKIVITGAKSIPEIDKATAALLKEISHYRKDARDDLVLLSE